MQRLPCKHGFDLLSLEALKFRGICFHFVTAFAEKFGEATRSRGCGTSLSSCLITACNASWEYAEVWRDSAKMEMEMSYFLLHGTHEILNCHGKVNRDRYIISFFLIVERKTLPMMIMIVSAAVLLLPDIWSNTSQLTCIKLNLYTTCQN